MLDLDEIKAAFNDYSPKMQGMEKASAVVLPIIRKDGCLCVLFEERAHGLKRQPGDICFPGGRIEQGEEPMDAALRETCEELLLKKDRIEIISRLDPILGPGNHFIFPYLGVIRGYDGSYFEEEVDHVFSIPLDYLMDQKPSLYRNKMTQEMPGDFPFHLVRGGRNYPFRGHTVDMYFYETDEGVIWGATSRILRRFLEILRQ